MELTDEQLDAAAKAALGAEPNFAFAPQRYVGFINGREAMRAAAPFLQMRWANPTDDEIVSIAQLSKAKIDGYEFLPSMVRWVIHQWLYRRNLALLSKPVDPRRAKVVAQLMDSAYTSVGNPRPFRRCAEQTADRILAALDAKE